MKKAFRKRYDFTTSDPEKYLIFLKKYFTKTKPSFYSVLSSQRVNTPDGVMYAVDLAEDIENPDYDTIAECFINGAPIYLWQDHCWGVAVDKNGEEISRCIISMPVDWELCGKLEGFDKFSKKSKPSNKRTALLFQIGTDPVE
jgi:hypothetical protein